MEIQKNRKMRRKIFKMGQIDMTKASHRTVNERNCRIKRSKRNKRSSKKALSEINYLKKQLKKK